jgi:PPOX class probable FMN-dependent enzyme
MSEETARATDPPAVFGEPVRTVEALRCYIPAPSTIAEAKVLDRFDHHCRNFIRLSTLVMLATTDRAGRCDSSPRGGPAGFVRILDDRCLLIPELSGNRMADSLRNLLENPQIGMMFIIPGLEEVLRLNGRAWVVQDKAILATAPVMGKVPVLGIGIQAEEIYMHCAKALKRSAAWRQAEWPDRSSLASAAQIYRDHAKGRFGDGSVGAMQDALTESYTKRLW